MAHKSTCGSIFCVGLLLVSLPANAENIAPPVATLSEIKSHLDSAWILTAAVLVMFMQFGFLLLEAGLVRTKNSIGVAMKNAMDFCVSTLAFSFIGFAIAFGSTSFFGLETRFIGLSDLEPSEQVFFVFQVMFCGTAATIVSGAVAERMRLTGYVLGSLVTGALIYPLFVQWSWGSALFPTEAAFLAGMGFMDFAGSTVVHATGAWLALAACIVLGPRVGKFDEAGRSIRFSGHNPVLIRF